MPDLILTAKGAVPALEKLLEFDVRYHFGVRDEYSYDFSAVVNADRNPDKWFLCFHRGQRQIIKNSEFRKCFRVEDDAIVEFSPSADSKFRRTINAINRDFDFLDREHYYCYDLQDARQIDYADFFGTDLPIPVIQAARRKDYKAIIIPLAHYHEYPSWNIPKVGDPFRFHEKKPIGFWRGIFAGTVGAGKDSESIANLKSSQDSDIDILRITFEKIPRYILCNEYRGNPKVDAKLVKDNANATIPTWMRLLYGERVPISDQCRYKNLISVDGNDGPSNFFWDLRSNSLVLKQDSEWELFGQCYFRPWVHFVPIAGDIADLEAKLDWCEAHQGECLEIVENAHAAWDVLFDPGFQVERRKHGMGTLSAWMAR